MKTRVILRPGQKGTKKLVTQYGDALVCVRYRYDVESRKQIKTVELVISESDWTPPPVKYSDSALVLLRIGLNDKSLQEQAKAIGGRWDREKQLWYARYGCIVGTKLEKLIVVETSTDEIKYKSL